MYIAKGVDTVRGENEGKNSIFPNDFSLPPDTAPSQEVLCIPRA